MSDQARVANRLEIGNGDSLSALEAAVLDEEVIAESTPNEKAKLAETLKNVADARSSNELVRIKRSQLRTTAIAAWVAIIGVVTLYQRPNAAAADASLSPAPTGRGWLPWRTNRDAGFAHAASSSPSARYW